MERSGHRCAVAAGMIPQQRERVGEDATFVHRRAGWEVLRGWDISARVRNRRTGMMKRQGIPGASPASQYSGHNRCIRGALATSEGGAGPPSTAPGTDIAISMQVIPERSLIL